MLALLDLQEGRDLCLEITQKRGEQMVQILNLVGEHQGQGAWLSVLGREGRKNY